MQADVVPRPYRRAAKEKRRLGRLRNTADLAYGNIIVTPVLAAGGYAEGDSKDLGGVFQFRTELGIAYELDDGTRIGARFAHVSNAFIHDDNPGEEELFITFAIPFR